jgi:hypothetical protein
MLMEKISHARFLKAAHALCLTNVDLHKWNCLSLFFLHHNTAIRAVALILPSYFPWFFRCRQRTR